MNYPTELCQLIICNMEIIESVPDIIASTEKILFTAINTRIKKAVKSRKGWKGCYEHITERDDSDETTFAPSAWPENEDKSYNAWYTLTATEIFKDYWLSNATGVTGAALCLEFAVDPDWSELTTKEYKRSLEAFYTGSHTVQQAGFCLAPSKKSIVRPFTFDADKLAAEFPDMNEALAPLDAALSDLFGAHGEFDKFVKGLK